jgi:hypothetical protein
LELVRGIFGASRGLTCGFAGVFELLSNIFISDLIETPEAALGDEGVAVARGPMSRRAYRFLPISEHG